MECVYACSLRKYGVIKSDHSLIRVIKPSEVSELSDVVVCRHCDPAPCIEVCEFGALNRDEVSGAVVLNEELCTSCKACLAVCPFNALLEVGGKVVKCDLCGGDPECVKVCDKGAITYVKAFSRELLRVKEVSERVKEVLTHKYS